MSVPVHLVDLPPLTAITHPPVDSLATAQLFLMKMAVPPQGQRRALLANATGDRFLPLLIESIDFGMALSMKNFDRFGLLDLTLRLLDVTGGVIENIEIQSLDAGVLVASLTVKSGEQKVTVEARPTDALALAVKQEIPLSLASPLMERDGWKIPDAEHIFARILARDVDEPYLIRVVDMLLQEAARWHESTDKWQLVPRDGMVWNSMQIIDKRDNSTMVKANAFPTYIPPDAFPAIVARLKHVGGLDLSVTDRERIGETTVDFAGKPVRLQIKTTPGAQGETLSLHCVPQPPEESDSPMERNSPASCVK